MKNYTSYCTCNTTSTNVKGKYIYVTILKFKGKILQGGDLRTILIIRIYYKAPGLVIKILNKKQNINK